jgi:hypothetical protein
MCPKLEDKNLSGEFSAEIEIYRMFFSKSDKSNAKTSKFKSSGKTIFNTLAF